MLSMALVLLSREKNKWGNIYLSLCFFSYTLFALDDGLGTLRYLGNPSDFWQLLNFPIFLTPLWIYLAIQHYAKQHKNSFRWAAPILFLPFLFRVLTWDVIDGIPSFHLPMTMIEDAVLLLFLILVAVISFLQLSWHSVRLKGFYSDLSPVNLSWLFRFLLGFILIRSMSLLISSFKPLLYLITLADLADFVILLYLAYHSITQKEIFPKEAKTVLQLEQNSRPRVVEKLKKTSLESSQIKQTKKRILNLMESQKPHLNPELTLPEMAQLLSMKTNELSYFLNDHLQENFYSFINRYRIEESKSLLLNPKYEHLSMLGIAMEAGFNSKTAFNTNFKKLTQQTPSDYRKTHKV